MINLKPAAVLGAIALTAGLGGCQGTQSYVKWRPDGQPLRQFYVANTVCTPSRTASEPASLNAISFESTSW